MVSDKIVYHKFSLYTNVFLFWGLLREGMKKLPEFRPLLEFETCTGLLHDRYQSGIGVRLTNCIVIYIH